jgi:hypothetical protein
MMTQIGSRLITLAILLLFITAACSAGNSDVPDGEQAKIAGPALVMFYTDN